MAIATINTKITLRTKKSKGKFPVSTENSSGVASPSIKELEGFSLDGFGSG
jgi:hypothetical protein